MRRTERSYELAVCASVVAVSAAFWLIPIATNEPPEFSHQYVQFAVAWLLFTTPWAIAARLVWRAWWVRNAGCLSAMDGPARLLAAALAMLPDSRRDWGAAMAAELVHVRGRSSRWRFATGSADEP